VLKKSTSYLSKKIRKIHLSGDQNIKLAKNYFRIFIEKDLNRIEINLSSFGKRFYCRSYTICIDKKIT